MPEPSGAEWVAVAAATMLIVAVGGLAILTPWLRRGTAVRTARVAGFLLACTAMSLVVVSAVLVGAGLRASMVSDAELAAGEYLPVGPWVRHLFDPSPATTERVAVWGALLLLPLAATFVVLALAVVDRVRSIGLRVVAAMASAMVALLAGYVALGTTTPFETDPGPLAGRAASAIAVLSLAALAALGVDAYWGSRSSSATTRSQRSRQSSQR